VASGNPGDCECREENGGEVANKKTTKKETWSSVKNEIHRKMHEIWLGVLWIRNNDCVSYKKCKNTIPSHYTANIHDNLLCTAKLSEQNTRKKILNTPRKHCQTQS
jgi:hypothetical protein